MRASELVDEFARRRSYMSRVTVLSRAVEENEERLFQRVLQGLFVVSGRNARFSLELPVTSLRTFLDDDAPFFLTNFPLTRCFS